MKYITKDDVEQLVDLLEGAVKLTEAQVKSFIYDMRMGILKDRWDEDSFHGEKYDELRERIEELEDENTELQERIDDLQ